MVKGPGHAQLAAKLLGCVQQAYEQGEMLVNDLQSWLLTGARQQDMPAPLYDWADGPTFLYNMWFTLKKGEEDVDVSSSFTSSDDESMVAQGGSWDWELGIHSFCGGWLDLLAGWPPTL